MLIEYYYVGVFFLSCALAFISIPICIALAHKYKILDIPDGRIKIHHKPTPYLGGVGVFVAIILPMMGIFSFYSTLPILYFIGLCSLLFTGLIDDLYSISPLKKYIGIMIAALCFMSGGCLFEIAGVPYFIVLIGTFFWFCSIINAANLVDIMDGLLTSLTLCIASFYLYLSYISYNSLMILLCCAYIGGLIVFWCYNKPTAQIYLGDTGSLFLGGIISLFPFIYTQNMKTITFSYFQIYIFTGIVSAIFLMEIILLMIIRTYKGIPFYKGSPDHFVSFLRRKKWSTWKILIFSVFLNTLLGLVAQNWLFAVFSNIATTVCLAIMLLFSLFIIYL